MIADAPGDNRPARKGDSGKESKNTNESARLTSVKTYENAIILSYFFGMFGIDRFYLGKIGTGIAKLITLGGLGVWYCADLLLTAFGHARDQDGLVLRGSDDSHALIKALVVLYVATNAFWLLAIVLWVAIWWFQAFAGTGF